jgi:hypothetical protein
MPTLSDGSFCPGRISPISDIEGRAYIILTTGPSATTSPPHRQQQQHRHIGTIVTATSPTTTSIDIVTRKINSQLQPRAASGLPRELHGAPPPAYNLNHSRRLPYDALSMLLTTTTPILKTRKKDAKRCFTRILHSILIY